MPIVNQIHVVVDAEADRHAGTNDPLTLTVSGGGADLFQGTWTGANALGNGHTVPQNRTGAALVPSDTDGRRSLAANSGSARSDLWAAMNYFVFRDEDPYSFGFDTAQLDPSSVRLSIRGNDAIYPRHIVVWGFATLPLADFPHTPAVVRTPVPLGMALNVNTRLSGQFQEGPQSMLIPRVAPWSHANRASGERVVDKVILTIGLGSDPNAGTSFPVRFRILTADGTVVCSHLLEGFDSLRSNEWKTWLVPVISPFTWSDIMSVPRSLQPCRLSIDIVGAIHGTMQVARVFAFGIDSTTTPPALLPLVHWPRVHTSNEFLVGGGRPETLLVTANHDDARAGPQRANYQSFRLQTGTPLHPTDRTFEFGIAGNGDVFAIKKSGTGSGTTEIHVLSAASAYQQFSLQTGTALHPTDQTFTFGVATNRDVFAIKKSGTGSGTTEIHVLSAASGYQAFSLQTGTALHPTDQTFEFAVAENRDVFAIKKSGTGSGTTEIHVLSAASGYQAFSLQTGTALHPTDQTFEFGIAPNRDVFAIKKSGTGTGTTEIHVLSAASGYQAFSLQTGTALHPTDQTFELEVARNRDVYAFKKGNTGTGTTEIHVLDR